MESDSSESLYETVRQAVHQQWDPIGVSSLGDGMGEYDGYIVGLCKLLEQQPSRKQILDYLWTVETETLGLSGDRNSTENFADWLYNLVN